ncbi:MAG: META domain-containing protein [Anaerolineae bacterium]
MLVTAAGFGQAAAAPADQAQVLEAKIQIVWPHTTTGQLAAVTAAPVANITANIFLPGTTTSVPCTFNSTVRLWVAVNNDPAVPIAIGTRRFVQVGGANPYYYPVWDFNDVNVSAATNPNNKIYMYVQVDGAQTISNVWIHAANALTYLPNPPQPTTTGGTPANVVGQIQIVFPHDRNGNQASVTTAPLANVRVALFEQGSNRSVSVNYNNNVFLLKGLNNDALTTDAVNPGTRTVITENGVTYPVWLFNDVDVSAAMNTANKYAFRVAVQGAGYTSNVWIHGAAAQTYLPEPDAVTGGGCAGTIPGTPQPTATTQPTGTPQPTATPQATATAIPLASPTPTTPATSQAPFVGPTWGWIYDVTANPPSQTAIPAPQNYTLLFNADGTVNIKADCNSVFGSYTTQGNALKITLGPSTTAACGPDSLDQQFLASLTRVGSYTLTGTDLNLMYADSNGMMVLRTQ